MAQADGAWHLVDGSSGVPLAGARCVWSRPGAVETSEVRSNPDGTLALGERARYLLVTAPGYVETAFDLTEQESRELRLSPACSLTLRFHDAAGVGVGGVRVRLLPAPRTGPPWGVPWRTARVPDMPLELALLRGRVAGKRVALPAVTADAPLHPAEACWLEKHGIEGGQGREFGVSQAAIADSWDLVSDDQGMVRWERMPASRGYRYGILSRSHVMIEPAFEEAGMDVGSPIPTDLSGEIQLGGGESKSLDLRVRHGSRILGTIGEAPRAGPPPIVKLFRAHYSSKDKGPFFVNQEQIDAVPVGENGAFVFAHVAPGEYVVESIWQNLPRDHFAVSELCSVPEGQDVDLGLLRSKSGHRITGHLRAVDQAGEAVDMERLAGQPLRMGFRVQTSPVKPWSAIPMNSKFSLGFNESFVIHGVPTGRAWFKADEFGIRWPGEFRAAYRIEFPPTIERHVDGDLELELVVAVLPLVEHSLLLQVEEGAEPEQLRWFLVSDDGRKSHDYMIRAPRAGEPWLCPVRIPIGRHTAFFCSDAAHTKSKTGLWATIRLDARPGRSPSWSQEVRLAAGSCIEGVYLGADERPIAGARLKWSFDFLASGPISTWAWPYRVFTDAKGRFRLVGVAPGVTLRGIRTDVRRSNELIIHVPPRGGVSRAVVESDS